MQLSGNRQEKRGRFIDSNPASLSLQLRRDAINGSHPTLWRTVQRLLKAVTEFLTKHEDFYLHPLVFAK